MKNSCAPLSINWDEMAAIEYLSSSTGRDIALLSFHFVDCQHLVVATGGSHLSV